MAAQKEAVKVNIYQSGSFVINNRALAMVCIEEHGRENTTVPYVSKTGLWQI